MTDWRGPYDRRDWDAVDDWWRGYDDDDRPEAKALLERLMADVPKIDRENGMEVLRDFMRPDEAPMEWKGAAEILYLGELAAWVEGEPVPVSLTWREQRRDIEARLHAFTDQREVTDGDAQLSRVAHAQEALEAFASIDFCISAMCNEIDPDGKQPQDRDWLRDFAEEITALAFHAGAEARAAMGKEIESHAIRGRKVVTAAGDGGERRSKDLRPKRNAVLEFMQRKVDAGVSVKRAAEFAFKAGYGTSDDANRKLWGRYKK